MKIAFVVHDYHRAGGHSRYVVELAERFGRDHEVHVFANTFSSDENTTVRFHHLPALRLTALTTILTCLASGYAFALRISRFGFRVPVHRRPAQRRLNSDRSAGPRTGGQAIARLAY